MLALPPWWVVSCFHLREQHNLVLLSLQGLFPLWGFFPCPSCWQLCACSVLGMLRYTRVCSSLVALLLEMTNPGAQLCPSLCVIENSSTT